MGLNNSHYVYNRQGTCLWGANLCEDHIENDITPEQAVAAYIEEAGGTLLSPPAWDEPTGLYWFLERLRGKEYNRYVVRAFGGDWPS